MRFRPVLLLTPVFLFLTTLTPLDSSGSTLNGRIYTDHYLYTSGSKPGSFEQSSLSGWIDYDQHHETGFGVRAIGQFDLIATSITEPDQPRLIAHLREGYASYLGTGLEVRVGQQIIPWGKSDGVNPTDYFTAKDYTLLNPDDEIKRQGAIAASVSFTPESGASPFTFQFVTLANYPQSKLLIPDQAIPSGVSFQKYPDSPTPFLTKNFEFGGKLSYQKSDFDCSISAFSGYSAFPEYLVDRSNFSVKPINPAEKAVGGDASFTVGSYVIRLETALHLPENGSASDPMAGLVQPNHWDSVVGAERPIGDDFRIQAQFLMRWYTDYTDPVIDSGNAKLNQLILGVAQANSLILNYQYQSNPGATFRFSYANDHSNWNADLFLIGYFAKNQDFLLRPQVGYTPITNLKLALGADLYGGDASRPLGALKSRSATFFEARYLF
jgi:hypothetical protein